MSGRSVRWLNGNKEPPVSDTLTINPRRVPALDPEFVPAVLWRRAYRARAATDPAARPVTLALQRPDGTTFVQEEKLLAALPENAALTLRFVEREVKTLLWQKGGSTVLLAGADDVARQLAAIYAPGGARAFDADFMGAKIYRAPFAVRAVPREEIPAARDRSVALGRHLDGCRIGFDLGGSDRKAAAVIDGKVVFTEEIAWSPYFEKDPNYHLQGINDSLQRAAAHLPRVDAIGGSAAGVYVDNEPRAGSLFRGVSPEDFERHIRPLFSRLQQRWGGVPFAVANDGEVTALAGSMSFGSNAVLGVAMGTSEAAGYVTPEGGITTWLNELAFVPVDYRVDAPRDEWSGDLGCGVQYFSQQGVARLAGPAGFAFAADRPLPERLLAVQEAMKHDDPRARAIYESLGVCFGYAVAEYADLFALETVLVLGRVASGLGGELLLETAREVLREEFPVLADSIKLRTPDETLKRHGQAIAAASLPALS